MKMIIRKATIKDLNELVDMQKDFYEQLKEFSKRNQISRLFLKDFSKLKEKKRLTKYFRKKNNFFIVAEESGKIIGYLHGDLERMKPLKIIVGYLDDFLVLKQFRNKGVGKKLHKEFIKWLKKKKVKWACLNVAWINKNVRKAYEKWGYQYNATKMIKRMK